MSDPRHRGRVIFFLLTARPDLMPIDLKRQGRAEEHIALFYPSTREEREELLRVMMKRTNVKLPMEEMPDSLLNGSKTFSGADMEALFTRAKFREAAMRGRGRGRVEGAEGSGVAEAREGARAGDGASDISGGAEAGGAGASSEPEVGGGVTKAILQEVVDDFIPPTYPEEVELQTLAAVLECTSQALLPERYRTMDRESMVKRVQELKRYV